MKKSLFALAYIGFGMLHAQLTTAVIDLNNIKEDKVAVSMELPNINKNSVIFHFPKTVPGTYSVDDYGRFIEGIKFLDIKGRELQFKRLNDNTYEIADAKNLKKVTYWVNDSFDEEQDESKHKAVFSPSGTNIESGKCYIINTHGFIGYLEEFVNNPYQVVINKPVEMEAVTALVDTDKSNTTDVFKYNRYFDVTDSPIMYAKPNYTTFTVGGIEIQLGVYSPNNVYKATDFKEKLEKMMQAQKNFLGDMNDNKKYAILLYLSDMKDPKIKGFGALEHHESTTVILPETMPKESLEESIKDVVSHEFFHTVNPLKCHSEEIHYFDYADPKMSKHLWLYEGGTEYFANLFQVQEGLINDAEFLVRMNEKVNNSKAFNDTMPFTEMSANVLKDDYKEEYRNVYEKGTLLTMCMDIFLLDKTNGKMNYREMVKQLAQKYGKDKPFKDDELIDEMVTITKVPELRNFYNQYINGKEATPFEMFLEKTGINTEKNELNIVFPTSDLNNIYLDPETKAGLIIYEEGTLSDFGKEIGLKLGDMITAIDDIAVTEENFQKLFGMMAYKPENEPISFTVKDKSGTVKVLKGLAKITHFEEIVLSFSPAPTIDQQKLQYLWLKGISK